MVERHGREPDAVLDVVAIRSATSTAARIRNRGASLPRSSDGLRHAPHDVRLALFQPVHFRAAHVHLVQQRGAKRSDDARRRDEPRGFLAPARSSSRRIAASRSARLTSSTRISYARFTSELRFDASSPAYTSGWNFFEAPRSSRGSGSKTRRPGSRAPRTRRRTPSRPSATEVGFRKKNPTWRARRARGRRARARAARGTAVRRASRTRGDDGCPTADDERLATARIHVGVVLPKVYALAGLSAFCTDAFRGRGSFARFRAVFRGSIRSQGNCGHAEENRPRGFGRWTRVTLGEFGFYQSSNLFRLFFSHATFFARAAMAGVRPPRKRSLPRVTRQLLDDIRKQLRNRWVRIPTRARSGLGKHALIVCRPRARVCRV